MGGGGGGGGVTCSCAFTLVLLQQNDWCPYVLSPSSLVIICRPMRGLRWANSLLLPRMQRLMPSFLRGSGRIASSTRLWRGTGSPRGHPSWATARLPVCSGQLPGIMHGLPVVLCCHCVHVKPKRHGHGHARPLGCECVHAKPLCCDKFHVKPSRFGDEHVQIGPPACWCIFILLKVFDCNVSKCL